MLGVPALPLEWDGQRFGLVRDIPAAGGQSSAVLREAGLGEAEIAGLRARGVIGGV